MFKFTRHGIRLEDWGPIHIISALEHLLLLPVLIACNSAILLFCWGAGRAAVTLLAAGPCDVAALAQFAACSAVAIALQLKVLPPRGKPELSFDMLPAGYPPVVIKALLRVGRRLELKPDSLPIPLMEKGFNARMVTYQENLLSEIEGRLVLGQDLLRESSTEELTCVIAHEIGHHLAYREQKPEFARIVWNLLRMAIEFPILFRFDAYLKFIDWLLEAREEFASLRSHAFEYFCDRVAMTVTSPQTLIASQRRFEEFFEHSAAMAYQKMIEQARASAPPEEQDIYTRMLNNVRQEPGFKEFAEKQKMESRNTSRHPSVEARCQAACLRASRAHPRAMQDSQHA